MGIAVMCLVAIVHDDAGDPGSPHPKKGFCLQCSAVITVSHGLSDTRGLLE